MNLWVAVILGAILLALVFQDAFEVMLLPRRVYRRMRLNRYYFTTAWNVWCAVA
ncbi:MAG: hypothetical protein ACJ8AW_10085 [Rhodopila sp.]